METHAYVQQGSTQVMSTEEKLTIKLQSQRLYRILAVRAWLTYTIN